MTVLWALIDPIAPGSASMFLLMAATYWLAFGVLGFTLAGRSAGLGALPPLLALLPPAFVLVGMIWRDVLFAVTWLLAVVLTFAVTDRPPRVRAPIQVLAFALCGLGVLLRPNSLIAAPLLAIYIAWPLQMRWKRTAILFVPAIAAFFGLVQIVYYGVLGATRQHPLQSIMIFDLGGISHFTKENQFPVTWNERDTALLLNGCYRPTEWDHLLAARTVRIRHAQGRNGREAVRHTRDHEGLDGCDRAAPDRLSGTPRQLHVEFSQRVESHDVGRRHREAQ